MFDLNCPFCKIKTIVQNPWFNIFESISPESGIHLLIAPKEHMINIDLEHWSKLLPLVEQLKQLHSVTSYTLKMNFNAPRQEVMHSHLHFLSDKKRAGGESQL